MRQLQEATNEYAKLLNQLESAEREIRDSKNRQINTVLLFGSQVHRKFIGLRTYLFLDLLRASIISYRRDPARAVGSLRNNLDSIDTLLTSFPAREPQFALGPPIRLACLPVTANGCVAIKQSAGTTVVEGIVFDGISSSSWPLYVVAGRSTPSTLPIYGIRATTRAAQ